VANSGVSVRDATTCVTFLQGFLLICEQACCDVSQQHCEYRPSHAGCKTAAMALSDAKQDGQDVLCCARIDTCLCL